MERDECAADILVVDDNSANLTAIEAALGDLNGRVVRAQSGSEALRLLLERDFALVLLDVKMPSMDGFETARMIRARKRSRHTPIVFITAHSRDDQEVLAAYALGAVDFLFKPIAPEVLRAKAAVFVELQARSAEVARQAELIREHERREHLHLLEKERERWEAEALRRQMEQLAEADRHKDQFLALLGHELRNPLASITAGLELMRTALDEKPANEAPPRSAGAVALNEAPPRSAGAVALNEAPPRSAGAVALIDHEGLLRTQAIVERQTRHLSRLVDDLLDIARIRSGKIELRKVPITLAEIVDQAVNSCRPMIDAQKQTLEVELPQERIAFEGDPVRLVQVLANLLNNASRYTPASGLISIRAARVKDGLEIRVRDNGRGMSSEFLPHAFDAFRQESDQPDHGLGLGLALARQIVALHEGSVSAHSDGLGRGSEIVVRLPIPPEGAMTQVRTRKTTPQTGTRPLSVMLIDDSEDVRELMAELLRSWGHRVEVACDGLSGLQLAIEHLPDVAFVDIGLPLLDGYGVATQLREKVGDKRPRLIAMTGFGRDADKQRARAVGFDQHIVKPATIEALKQALSFKDTP